jgi:hypothetical protein
MHGSNYVLTLCRGRDVIPTTHQTSAEVVMQEQMSGAEIPHDVIDARMAVSGTRVILYEFQGSLRQDKMQVSG